MKKCVRYCIPVLAGLLFVTSTFVNDQVEVVEEPIQVKQIVELEGGTD